MSQTTIQARNESAGTKTTQKITPFLWFDGKAEEAANFYCSIFKNSHINTITHYSDEVSNAAGQPAGSVMTVSFVIEGQEFVGLNGGPMFKFSEAISFAIKVDTQEELDDINSKLISGGGEQSYCGWLKDKFGLSWQITPSQLDRWLSDPDPEKGRRVMAAIMDMKKLDIPTLQRAYDGR
jgi:predicted 3-demethylubiquinone-9 3-methyltransferase (glyoxalase superfamily)